MIIAEYPDFLLIVVHIPKAAGSSLRLTLRQYKKDAIRWEEYTNIVNQVDQTHTCLYYDYLQSKITNSKLPLKIITSVRNPYDRIYSAFLFNQRTDHYRRNRLQGHPRIKWFQVDFLDFVKKELSSWVEDYRKSSKEGKSLETVGVHFAPISIFLTDQTGRMRGDYFVRQETFSQDVDKVCQKLFGSLPRERTFNCSNKSTPPRTHGYLKYYDNQALAIINKLYSDEFILFGYRKLQKVPDN